MKVTYDQEVDVLRVVFSSAKIHESDEDKPGVILDYDKDGNVVGIEPRSALKTPAQSSTPSQAERRTRPKSGRESRGMTGWSSWSRIVHRCIVHR
jgi:uncharacterized protein YuzE